MTARSHSKNDESAVGRDSRRKAGERTARPVIDLFTGGRPQEGGELPAQAQRAPQRAAHHAHNTELLSNALRAASLTRHLVSDSGG